MLIHVYKCPGPFKRNGLCYDLKSADSDDIPSGWFDNLTDAVKAAGTRSLAPKKKDEDEKKAKALKRAKKMAGLPYVAPALPALSVSENDMGHEDLPPIEMSNENDKKTHVFAEGSSVSTVVRDDLEPEKDAQNPFTPKLTDGDKLDILELERSGAKVKDIAEKFDVSRATIYKVLKEIKETK